MMKPISITLFSCVLLLTAVPLLAQTMSGDNFINTVLSRHPENKVDHLNSAAFEASSDRVALWPNPSIVLSRENVPYGHDAAAGKDAAFWGLQLNQRIPWPSTLASEYDVFKAKIDMQSSQYTQAKKRRELQARDLFITLAHLYLLSELEQESVTMTEAIFTASGRRLRVGLGTHHEMTAAENDLQLAKLNQERAQLNWESYRDYACLLINENNCAAITWEFKAPYFSPQSQADLDFRLAALQTSTKLAESESHLLERQSLPQLSTGGMVMQTDGGMQMYSLMLGIDLPIFSRAYNRAAKSEWSAKKTALVTTQQWYEAQKKLSLQVVQLQQRKLATDLKLMRSQLLPRLKNHVQTLIAEYAVGKTNFAAAISGRKQLIELQRLILSSERDAEKLSIQSAAILSGTADVESAPSLLPMLSGSMVSDSMDAQMNTEMAPMRKNMPKKPNSLPEQESFEPEAMPRSGGGMQGM